MSEETTKPTVRETLHEAIQSTIAIDDDMPEGAMLKGWVVVAEWVSPENDPWISRVSGSPAGDSLAAWSEQGLLHHALHFMWGGEDDEAEDEDE